MRFTILTEEQRLRDRFEKRTKWHKKFAWMPVRMKTDPTIVVWLGFVLRKGNPRDYTPNAKWNWEYVEITFDILKMGPQ
jgi:hypothetical protein